MKTKIYFPFSTLLIAATLTTQLTAQTADGVGNRTRGFNSLPGGCGTS